jgi:hypothetical protein
VAFDQVAPGGAGTRYGDGVGVEEGSLAETFPAQALQGQAAGVRPEPFRAVIRWVAAS